MKAIFKTSDAQEAKRLVKADDMASFIFSLVHNGWREFKDTDYDYEKAWNKIYELLEEHDINVNELW